MKHLYQQLTFLLLLLAFLPVHAQDGCTTASLDSVEIVNQPWFGNNQFLYDFMATSDFSGGASICRACRVVGSKYRIPLKALIYRRINGFIHSDGMTQQRVADIVREVNRLFEDARTGIQFYLDCHIEYVNNSKNYEGINTRGDSDKMFRDYKRPGSVMLHFIRNSSDIRSGRAARGTEPENRSYGLVVTSHTQVGVPRTNSDIANTIVHELGHVFNLDHTHDAGRASWNDNNGENGLCYQESVDRNRGRVGMVVSVPYHGSAVIPANAR